MPPGVPLVGSSGHRRIMHPPSSHYSPHIPVRCFPHRSMCVVLFIIMNPAVPATPGSSLRNRCCCGQRPIAFCILSSQAGRALSRAFAPAAVKCVVLDMGYWEWRPFASDDNPHSSSSPTTAAAAAAAAGGVGAQPGGGYRQTVHLVQVSAGEGWWSGRCPTGRYTALYVMRKNTCGWHVACGSISAFTLF